jgi:hypothetical protein
MGAAMSNKVLALIGVTLLSGSASAEQILYSNPYDPAGNSSNCFFSSGCQIPGTQAEAQLFSLSNAATLQTVSFTASDPKISPQNSYEWAIYADKDGLPTGPAGPLLGGNVTVVPLASGDVFRPGSGQSDTYSVVNIGGSDPSLIDVYTFSLGSVNLGAGNYFLALEGFGPETSYQSWAQGLNNSGAVSSEYGVWSSGVGGGPPGGLAMTIKGMSAPEIDPSSIMGGLTLLLGSLTVLRGRRPGKIGSLNGSH